MRITAIIGRAGCGKSRLLYEEAWDNIRKAEPMRIHFLVPEQATHLTERRLLSPPDIMGCMRTEVLSFRRLFGRLNRDEEPRIIDEVEKRLLLTAIMRTAEFDAEPFASIKNRPGFIASLSEQIKVLKRADAESSDFEDIGGESTETGFTTAKLDFIGRVYEAYEAALSREGLRDVEDCISGLAVIAADETSLKGVTWFIDGFSGFTPQEQAALEGILSGAHEAKIALCLDPVAVREDLQKSRELFTGNMRTFEWFRDFASARGYEFVIKNIEPDGGFKRFASPGIAALEGNLFTRRKSKGSAEGVVFCPVDSERVAARLVASKIKALASSGYRYRDIAVVLRDFGTLADALVEAFAIADIPHFLDRRQPLRGHPLSRLVESAWELILKNFHRDVFLDLLRTGLAPITPDETDILENYLLEYGLSFDAIPAEWLEAQPASHKKGRRNDRRERLREIAIRVLEPLCRFRERVTEAAKADGQVADYSKATAELLEDWQVAERMHTLAVELELDADEETRIYKTVTETLAKISRVMGDMTLSPSDYAILLRSALDVLSAGRIPPALDAVIIGGILRSRIEEAKAIFICGLDEGVFPRAPSGEGLFDDRELRGLTERFPDWIRDYRLMQAEEDYLFYIACTRAREKLFLVYPRESDEGGAPSPFVREAARALGMGLDDDCLIPSGLSGALNANEFAGEIAANVNDQVEADETRAAYAELHTRTQPVRLVKYVLSSLAYANAPELDKDGHTIRAAGLTKLDASRLKSFANCPFQYFANYDLKIKPRLMSRITRLELGSFVHKVLETCFRGWFESGDAVAFEDIETYVKQAEGIARSIADGFRDGILIRDPREQLVLETRIYPLLRKFVQQEMQRLGEIQFRPRYFEWRFGVEGRPGVMLPVSDDRDVELNGVIDRIDTGPSEGSGAIALDYKLSIETSGLPLRMTLGLETQLPIYLKALSDLVGERPLAGLLYCLERKREGSPKDGRKGFKRRGIFIKGAVPDEIAALGNVKTDGVEEEAFSSTVEKAFERLTAYARRLSEGDIGARPYIYRNKEKPCTWCDYRDLCRLDPAVNPYRHPETEP